MARYLFQFSYTPEAWAALTQNPVDRRPAIQALAEKIGGRLIEFSYAFGEYDGVAIFEAPNETAMTAAILAAIGPGHLKATKTTVLIPVEQALEAMRTAGGLSYQAPVAQP
jgi:uncharacterized protein with GYD domain